MKAARESSSIKYFPFKQAGDNLEVMRSIGSLWKAKHKDQESYLLAHAASKTVSTLFCVLVEVSLLACQT